MANPVSTSETKSNYDVFLSFRGIDTRHTFTGYLYDALCRKGIKTFMDDENLRVGETVKPHLLKAIEESKISIIVFSENYAASTWCLDELVKILECHKEKDQLVFPIFYKVEPSDVRHQRNSYEQAMTANENKFGCDSEKVQKWRSALFEVSNITGYHLKEGYEFKFIQDIVSKAATKVSPKQLAIEEHVVGLQFRVAEVKSLLDIESHNNTSMLGILGTGGIGKTTLAKALYNSICNQFEGACFLFNVRKTSNQDKGQVRLQQMLLSEMLEEGQIELISAEKGISTIKERISTKRVLIVLDDVDKIEQLKELAGGCDWFGSGSRIIITTRDEYLLVTHQVEKIYKMELLNDRESLELFCQNAFKMSFPTTNYKDLSNRAIRYAKGLPLALKVIGSNLVNKDLKQWESALDKYEKNAPTDIHSILRISYDGLERNEKDIFLDIACFFNGQRLEYVKRILDGCEFYSEDGIKILVDRSLVMIEYDYLRMHDLIQDMGREIIKQEAPKEVGERSRLWFSEDVLEVLTENTNFEHLTYMNFSYCQLITQFPDVSGAKNLRELMLNGCKKLVKVDKSVGLLPNLVYLSASECTQLRSFLARICLPSLEYLSFDLCKRLVHFPDVVGKMDKPLKICMKNTVIKELPHSFGDLIGLGYIDMTSCKELRNLPSSLFRLPDFVTLKIGGCPQLRELFKSFKGNHSIPEFWPNLRTLHFSNACLSDEDLHIILQSFLHLEHLNVSSNYFVSFPACIKESICMTSLDVSYCLKLQEIPELPSSVRKVDARHCSSLTTETTSMLWSQVCKEINRLVVVMPKTEIPNWLDYHDHRGIPTFWARGKFPIVALVFVFNKMNYQAVGLHLYIDGEHVHIQCRQFNVAEDHVLLCDIRALFSDKEWERLDARIRHDNDWKRVQVQCETDIILGHWGFYVYKLETSMDDIQFTYPHPELSGIGSLPVTNTITIPRDEVEVASATASSGHVEDSASTIIVEEASCLEHVEVPDESKPHTRTCSSCYSTILSTFKKLLCCETRGRSIEEIWMSSPETMDSSGRVGAVRRHFACAEAEGDVGVLPNDFGDGNNFDHDQQVHPSFSESLQTVVSNLKRAAAPRREKDLGSKLEDGGNDDNCSLEWLLNDDEEVEGEWSDVEA